MECLYYLGLILVDVVPRHPSVAGYTLLAGTVIFSGSLYALVLTGQRALGAITPIGGMKTNIDSKFGIVMG